MCVSMATGVNNENKKNKTWNGNCFCKQAGEQVAIAFAPSLKSKALTFTDANADCSSDAEAL